MQTYDAKPHHGMLLCMTNNTKFEVRYGSEIAETRWELATKSQLTR